MWKIQKKIDEISTQKLHKVKRFLTFILFFFWWPINSESLPIIISNHRKWRNKTDHRNSSRLTQICLCTANCAPVSNSTVSVYLFIWLPNFFVVVIFFAFLRIDMAKRRQNSWASHHIALYICCVCALCIGMPYTHNWMNNIHINCTSIV